jgi:diadenosine tetraphosphate (Ap4A) HIT family hydrolase
MGNIFRTNALAEQYAKHIEAGNLKTACPLCERAALHEFLFWKILTNRFPYDRIAEVHHMLVLRRHAPDNALTPEELKELTQIKSEYVSQYQYIIEVTAQKKSIPEHVHYHLIVARETLICD